MVRRFLPWLCCAIICFANICLANPNPKPAPAQQSPQDILRSLTYRTGTIDIGSGLARIRLTDEFTYLDSHDTETVLKDVWGNPPEASSGTLGMIVPRGTDLDAYDGWAVILEYDDSGYVSDKGAADIDYDELMKSMQRDAEAQSAKREKQGYRKFSLLGWAQLPHYDARTKKLYWAKRLRFAGDEADILNYNIRILGRRGVLILTAVAKINMLPTIEGRADAILGMVDFNQGNTYAEFDPKIDKAAAYGIAGLIAGATLAKVGFFKALLVLLLAAKKAIVVAALAVIAAISAALRRVFGRGKK